jgi:myosin heavy subunit
MFHQTNQVWVPSAEEVWELAEILSHDGDTIRIKRIDTSEADFKAADVHPADPSHLINENDLCKVNNLHEAPLLGTLRSRYKNDCIYTDIGHVLISINPYKTISGLYDEPLNYLTISDTFNTAENLHERPPHIYKIANDALRLFYDQTHLSKTVDQSIIISGESGSGIV